MSKDKKISIPEYFKCPISLEIMQEPVICEDGYTYDKESIIGLKDSISPVTGQFINTGKLIANRNLKNMITDFLDKNNMTFPTKKKTETTNLPNLMEQMRLDRMSALEKFEEGERQKELARIEQIKKEILDREKRQEEERLKKRREKEEEEQLERVLNMFNNKPMPIFTTGRISTEGYPVHLMGWNGIHYYYGWVPDEKTSLKLNTHMLKNIKDSDIYEIYSKILESYFFLKKYLYGEFKYKNQGFIDYCYDIVNPKIDSLILECENGIKSYELSIKLPYMQCDPIQMNNYNQLIQNSKKKKSVLLFYKKMMSEKPREFYYLNDDINFQANSFDQRTINYMNEHFSTNGNYSIHIEWLTDIQSKLTLLRDNLSKILFPGRKSVLNCIKFMLLSFVYVYHFLYAFHILLYYFSHITCFTIIFIFYFPLFFIAMFI